MIGRFAILEDRGVVALGGDEARRWLQGLVSNDIRKVAPDRCLYAALLTPQGKFLHDFIVVDRGARLLLDTEARRLGDLKKRLGFYRLRSKVTIEDASAEFAVAAIVGDDAAGKLGLVGASPGSAVGFAGGVAFVDPRLGALGCRTIAPRAGLAEALIAVGLEPGLDYESHRLALGVPDGSRDMPPDGAFPMECNFEELNGVDFDKGCYVGQETTTRAKRRGVLRRRLMQVLSDAELPAFGTPIMLGEREAGEMRSVRGTRGLALMRLELAAEAAANGGELMAGDTAIRAELPSWIGKPPAG